jgi:hypothetical protein
MISFVLLAIMLATQFISILHRNKIVIDQNPPDISVAEPKVDLEETDEGESWSIHSLKILAVRCCDVAARGPFVFPIVQSWPSDRFLALLTWSEPSVHLALHHHW